MFLNGGELDGVRILGRKAVESMTMNHLAPGLLPYEMAGQPSPGYGYGLGVKVCLSVAHTQTLGSVGAFGWGGAASTDFWIDPQEELVGIQMSQFQPSGFHLIAEDFQTAVYQSIVD